MTKRFLATMMAVLLVAFVQSAKATMIVVIYTADGYWIGSDSFRSGSGKPILVCKIHETRFGLLAKSGTSQGETESGDVYSTDKEVEDILATSDNVETFKAVLVHRLAQDIEEELAFLVDDHRINSANLKKFYMDNPIPEGLRSRLTRSVVLFQTKRPHARAELLLMGPRSYKTLSWQFKPAYSYEASPVFNWYPVEELPLPKLPPPHPAFSFASSVRQLSYVVSYERSNEWIQQNSVQALTEIMDKGHNEQPSNIGPPYTIIHVVLKDADQPEVKWIYRGVCPRWEESVNRENTLTQLRDTLRQDQSTKH